MLKAQIPPLREQTDYSQMPVRDKPGFVAVIGEDEVALAGLGWAVNSQSAIGDMKRETAIQRQRVRALRELLDAHVQAGFDVDHETVVTVGALATAD